MKRVKIILSAVVALAIVGGALAFKAKSANYCYYEINQAQDACPFKAVISTFVNDGTGTFATTDLFDGECDASKPLSECDDIKFTQTAVN
jgi:hypothetical protein